MSGSRSKPGDRMKRFKEVAESEFDRTEPESFVAGEMEGPLEAITCTCCFGSGWEVFRDADGYRVARRCDHHNIIATSKVM